MRSSALNLNECSYIGLDAVVFKVKMFEQSKADYFIVKVFSKANALLEVDLRQSVLL